MLGDVTAGDCLCLPSRISSSPNLRRVGYLLIRHHTPDPSLWVHWANGCSKFGRDQSFNSYKIKRLLCGLLYAGQ